MNVSGVTTNYPIGYLEMNSNSVKGTNDFDLLLQQIGEDVELQEMKESLDKKYNINIVISDYSCERTDSQAESYDLFSLDEKYDMHGGRNVVISKKSLLRMKVDPRFREKVIKSIEDMPWRGKLTGGIVKSTGVFIHEDGSGGYWMEFDWGDEEETKKPRVKYDRQTGENNLITQISKELSDLGIDFESVAPILVEYRLKKE